MSKYMNTNMMNDKSRKYVNDSYTFNIPLIKKGYYEMIWNICGMELVVINTSSSLRMESDIDMNKLKNRSSDLSSITSSVFIFQYSYSLVLSGITLKIEH